MDVAGKRVLVLGGSGVLGGLIALALSERGAAVALAGRDAERLDAASEDLGDVPTLRVDLLEPGAAARVVAGAAEALGGLDGIVNAAGVVAFGPLAEHEDGALEQVIAADLIAPLQVIREAIPHLAGGFVLNVTGVVAERPMAGMVPYVAAKAGLSAATRALARELRRQGTLVIDARPPHTETGLATRPISGFAPSFPTGLEPAGVADRLLEAIADDEREIPAASFTGSET